jgi:hypothetical protein
MIKKVLKPEREAKANKGIGGRGGGSAKRSGTYFENSVADFFNETGLASARRVIGSGAFGKVWRDANLLGDVYIDFPFLKKPILAEAKFGYGGKTQVTVKKEWIEKIIEEAKVLDRYPALIFKFKGARGEGSRMIAFSWETFIEMMKDCCEE